MYPDNGWYGHKVALADYCDLAHPRPVFGSISHGWYPSIGPGIGDRRIAAAPHFVWNARHLKQARARGVKNVRCIGAPFAYLVAAGESVANNPLASGARGSGTGTLAMPHHSADGLVPDHAAAQFIGLVEDNCLGPYTVSVYYQDLKQPYVDIYRARGWRIVSFGARTNPRFLSDLHAELLGHEQVVSDGIQTGLVYGALLGKRIRVLGGSAHLSDPLGLDWLRVQEFWPQIHADGLQPDEARDFGRFELGADHLLEPVELRQALGWANPATRVSATAIKFIADMRHRRSGASKDDSVVVSVH